jgi:hypothetical protein
MRTVVHTLDFHVRQHSQPPSNPVSTLLASYFKEAAEFSVRETWFDPLLDAYFSVVMCASWPVAAYV